MKPLASVDLATGEPAWRSSSGATSRRSRRSRSWRRRRSRGSSPGPRREVRRRRARRLRRRLASLRGAPRLVAAAPVTLSSPCQTPGHGPERQVARPCSGAAASVSTRSQTPGMAERHHRPGERRRAGRVHGRRQDDARGRDRARRTGSRSGHRPRGPALPEQLDRELFSAEGEEAFRVREAAATVTALRDPAPACSRSAAARHARARPRRPPRHAVTVLPRRRRPHGLAARAGQRPAARARARRLPRALRPARTRLPWGCATSSPAMPTTRSSPPPASTSGAVHSDGSGSFPGDGPVALVSDPQSPASTAWTRSSRSAPGLPRRTSCPRARRTKTLAALDRLWQELRLDRRGDHRRAGRRLHHRRRWFRRPAYLGGIAWVPVATSLVAQVDAAIGGKTAIDLPQGKNLVARSTGRSGR